MSTLTSILLPNFSTTTLYGIILLVASLLYAFYVRPIFLSGSKAVHILKGVLNFTDALMVGFFLLGVYLIWVISIIEDSFNVDSKTALIISIVVAGIIVLIFYKLKNNKPTQSVGF